MDEYENFVSADFSSEADFEGKPCPPSGCFKVSYQHADISALLEIDPDISIGKVVMECCGEPEVVCTEKKCGNSLNLTITQKIGIKIPIFYKIEVKKKVTEIECNNCVRE